MPVRPPSSVLLTILMVLVAACPTVADPPRVEVVAHPAVSSDTLSYQQLRRIYLGKTTRWEDGRSIHPVLFHGEPVHGYFVREVLGRSPESFSVYWKRMVFTGKGRPPLAFERAEALADYVRETPGAIGFLPAPADTAGLKLLALE